MQLVGDQYNQFFFQETLDTPAKKQFQYVCKSKVCDAILCSPTEIENLNMPIIVTISGKTDVLAEIFENERLFPHR